jgi:predicted dehydrogenase
MPNARTKIGIIGCGNISGIYCQAGQKFDAIDIVAVADLDSARAVARAAEFNVPHALSVEDLLTRPEIELVVNLTVPAAHATVARAALEQGKSVYNEKPLAVSREEAAKILGLASETNLRVGCAPDTFLGAGLQTCRKLLDDGWIGEPVGAMATMLSHGPESWHPSPEFYYQPGGGPMLDMGPYYLTALTTLLGPVKRVCGSARASFPERTITNKLNYGATITVAVDTHVAGVLDFASGVIGTILMSFDVWSTRQPCMEIYGTHGTLGLPDPNTFGGPVLLRRADAKDWSEIPLAFGYEQNSRGLGVADMAAAMWSGRPHRACGDIAFHVLDIMQSIHEASRENRYIVLQSTMERPDPLPLGLLAGRVEI